MDKIGIISPANIKPNNLVKRLEQFVSQASILNASHFSNLGTHFDINDTRDKTAHIYAPLNSSFTKAFIVREFPVLYANDFTVCWLAKMLLDMGDGGELYIEIPDEKVNKNRNHLTFDLLNRKLPCANAEHFDSKWVRMLYSKDLPLDIQALCTIYTIFHNKFEEFLTVWSAVRKTEMTDTQNIRSEAMRTYIYSLFGANQKCFVCERIIRKYFGDSLIKGLDMGGGYGFLAAELACSGHTIQMIDYNAKNVTVAHWITKQCGVENNLSLKTGNIEEISGLDGKYDLISYFGCLLYLDRQYIPEVLKYSMSLLKPRGILIIHENPKGVIKPESPDYNICFELEELINFLTEYAGSPVFYNMFTANSIPLDNLQNRVIMAVVKKV